MDKKEFGFVGDNDFPEDAHLENGNYINHCCDCGRPFIGHKRRVICKLCQKKNDKSKKESRVTL